MSSFSPLVRARALRRLLANGALWGAYGQLVVVSGPIFTGFALWMGLEASEIAIVASIVALAGLIQPLSFFIAGRVRSQKTFVLVFGLLEITLVAGIITVPFVSANAGTRFVLTAVTTLAGTMMGNLAAPVFNAWFSTLLPQEARARNMGRRLVLVNLAAMAAGYGAGQFVDLMGGTHIAFAVPYLVAWLVGVGGYMVLNAVPFPSILRVEGEVSFSRAMTAPLRDAGFRRLLLFYLMWVFAVLVADPFYNVYMIRDLKIRYATIGILNSVVLSVGIFGYWVSGSIMGRFGSKPVLQMLIIPRLILPLVWVFLTGENSRIVLPVIMVLNGLVFSGLTVAVNTLLFGSVPESGDRAVYFATWAFTTAVVTSGATATGALVVRVLEGFSFEVFGLQVGAIKITFILSAVLLIVPTILVRRVHDTQAKPVVHLLGQVLRGNPLSFVYNAFVFSRMRGTRSRARALRAMGRSRSPMAVDRLAKAMDDADPDVREQAARGLGETRSADAVDPLTRALDDEESDVRAEAATSLGRLRHPRGIDPLFRALESGDTRVAISAARALGDVGGVEVRERLHGRLVSGAGKELLPSLVESLSRLEDARAVPFAVRALGSYKSQAVRLQLLNAACRALGARNMFYKLLAMDDYELAERLDQMLQTAKRRFKRISSESRQRLLDLLAVLGEHLEAGRYADIAHAARDLAEAMDLDSENARDAREALRLFVAQVDAGHAVRAEIFSMICLALIVDSVAV